MIETDLAYAAGYLEADGCISLETAGPQRRWVHLFVRVSSVDPEVPTWLHREFGGRIYTAKYKPSYRTQFRWNISARGAESFLKQVRPFMRLDRKIKAADLALEFMSFTQTHSWITRMAHHHPEILSGYAAYRKLYQSLLSALAHKGPDRNYGLPRNRKETP